MQNTCFSVGCTAHIHYFKDIRQGALQCDCVILFGTELGMMRVGVRDEVVMGGLLGCERKEHFWAGVASDNNNNNTNTRLKGRNLRRQLLILAVVRVDSVLQRCSVA